MSNFKELIKTHNLAITAKFVPFSQSRDKGKEFKTLNWKVTLTYKDKPIVTTDYSAGQAHCPAYKEAQARERRMHATEYASLLRRRKYLWDLWQKAIDKECECGHISRITSSNDVITSNKKIEPDHLNVIASLLGDTEVLQYARFEDWASDYGFDSDSMKAKAIYDQCIEIALKLKNSLSSELLEQLQEAAREEGY